MYFGHTYDNYGVLDFLDVGYRQNGLNFQRANPSIIGSGPIASAPVASENEGMLYYDNVTGSLYQSVGGAWVGVNAWLMDGTLYITSNGENINVDDPNLFIFINENGEPFINENNEPVTTED